MTKTVLVEGMKCEHCEARVKKALEKLDGVDSAEVSRETGSAKLTLSSEPDESALKAAVESAGYTFKGVQ